MPLAPVVPEAAEPKTYPPMPNGPILCTSQVRGTLASASSGESHRHIGEDMRLGIGNHRVRRLFGVAHGFGDFGFALSS